MSLLMDSRKKWSSSTTETNGAFGMKPPRARFLRRTGDSEKCRDSPLHTLYLRAMEAQCYCHVNISLGLAGKFPSLQYRELRFAEQIIRKDRHRLSLDCA